MKQSRVAVALLIAMFSVIPFVASYNAYALSQTFQAFSFWGSSASPLVASPGSSNLPLTIELINLGPNMVTSLSVSFLSSYPLIPTQGEPANLSTYEPVSQPGSSVSMTGYYSIYSNASQGIYNETLLLKYDLGATSYSQNISFTLAILGPPPVPQSFEAVSFWGSSAAPLLASPGSKNMPLQLTVYNTGPNTVFNTSVTFTPSSPLIPVSGQQTLNTFMPVFRPGSSLSLAGFFDILPNASNGVYNEELIVTYSNGTKYFTSYVNVQIAITGYSSIQLSSYGYLPASIYPGYPSSQLQLALLNTGNSPAFDVNVTLYTSYPARPLYAGSNTKFLGFLPVGQPVTVQFPLSIDNTTAPVNSTFQLRVLYNDDRSINFTIPFVEYPKADLVVAGIATPQLTVGDGSAYITLSLQNKGAVEAQGTSIAMVPSNVFQPSIPSTASPLLATTYLNTTIGNVMPGETSNVTYVVSINSNIPAGTYTLLFVASWTQAGAQYPFYEIIPVQLQVHGTITQSLGEQFSNPLFLIIIAVLIILVIVGVIAIARSRRRRKEQ
ncbi:MAG: hypothetical protein QXV32_03865 [Conexivisphaerales archaeon]